MGVDGRPGSCAPPAQKRRRAAARPSSAGCPSCSGCKHTWQAHTQKQSMCTRFQSCKMPAHHLWAVPLLLGLQANMCMHARTQITASKLKCTHLAELLSRRALYLFQMHVCACASMCAYVLTISGRQMRQRGH